MISRTTVCRILVACLFGFVFAAPVFAGSVFEFATKEFGSSEPIISTVQMTTSGANTRIEIISVTSGEAGGLIFHGNDNEMIILDHFQGSYIAIDQTLMSAMAGEVSAAMSQRDEALAAMPPEQRALEEQMMQERTPAQKSTLSPDIINELGSHGEVAGVPCKIYEVIRDDRKVRELCVSEWSDLEGGEETASALRGVASFFEEMRRAFSGAGGMDVFDRQQELFGQMNELDGYPILYRDFNANGSLSRETQLTAARQQDISPEFFNPPAAYAPQEMPQDPN